MEKRNVSLANILHNEVPPVGKSFTHIKKDNDPKRDPCGTSVKMIFHENVCPFKTTHSCRSFK